MTAPRLHATPITLPTHLVVARWSDPLVERHGHTADSLYVETWWLPVLGPSAVWLLRHLAREVTTHPAGVDLDTADLAARLGLAPTLSANAPLARTFHRLRCFTAAQASPDGHLWAVRTHLGDLPQRHHNRLPASLTAATAAAS